MDPNTALNVLDDFADKTIEEIRKETSQLASIIKQKKDLKSQKAAEEKALGREIEELNSRMIALMNHQGLDQFRINGVGLFTKGIENYPSAEDNALLRKYLLDNNMAELLTVNAARLKTFVKDLPDTLNLSDIGVRVFTKEKLSVRKA